MPEAFNDAVLLSALEHTRGFDRELLISALGRSDGRAGPSALRRFANADSGEKGTARAAALQALGRRVGADDTELYASALTDRSVYVQLAAITVVARVGDVRAADDVFACFRRTMQRKGRTRSWDPSEIPSVLQYADRNALLTEFALLLRDYMSFLEDEERTWLSQVWPAGATGSWPYDAKFQLQTGSYWHSRYSRSIGPNRVPTSTRRFGTARSVRRWRGPSDGALGGGSSSSSVRSLPPSTRQLRMFSDAPSGTSEVAATS